MGTWGGRREAGPGKKIGRPALSEDERKLNVSLTITPAALAIIDGQAAAAKLSRSSYIDKYFKNLKEATR